MTWVERLSLRPSWLPAIGWLAGRPVVAWLHRRDPDLLRDLIEDTFPPAAAP